MTEMYERIDGSFAVEGWDGIAIPVPPAEVRDRLMLPSRYAYATLHEEVAEPYKKGVLTVCRKYVEQFGDASFYGKWLTLAGTSGAGKTWGAAAVVNEIVMRFAADRQFDVYWLPVAWELPKLFDFRTFQQREEYGQMRRRIMGCDLLVVDDLLHAAEYSMVKEFLFGVYDYRHQHRKPILTTMNGDVRPDDWSVVEQAFNGPFARRLAGNSKGFTLSV